jgi:sulfide:quinone oxidoreductase
MADSDRLHVVIAGAGVAAVETGLALRELAESRVRVTLVAPDHDFVHRLPATSEAIAHPEPDRYPLTGVAEALAAELVRDRAAWVDREHRVMHTATGAKLDYDVLVLCLGATEHRRYPHALTIEESSDGELEWLLNEVGRGEIARLAFIATAEMGWPLPLYEVALRCAARARSEGRTAQIAFLTTESGPLRVFGDAASRSVAKVLAEAGVRVAASVRCEVPDAGHVRVTPHTAAAAREGGHPRGSRVRSFDRVVTLPELRGPHIRGIPLARNGFIPINPQCRVRGAQRVYAAGDATDFPVKHAGIAAQQADVVASAIAALAGVEVRPRMFRAKLEGTMLTGGDPLYLSAVLAGGHSFSSEISAEPRPDAPATVAVERLRAHLGHT